MLAFIHVFSICIVATILFVSVDAIEPNHRYASVLKLLIVFVMLWQSQENCCDHQQMD
jgi:hypothetical protein